MYGQSTRIPKPEWFGHWGIPLQSQPFGGHSLSWGCYNLPLAICGRWCWFILTVLGHTDNNLYIYLAEWLVFSPSKFILYNHYFEALAAKCLHTCMDVSENRGTPKSSILIGFSIINHPFWGTPIFGNTHICIIVDIYIDVYNIHMRSISTYLKHLHALRLSKLSVSSSMTLRSCSSRVIFFTAAKLTPCTYLRDKG